MYHFRRRHLDPEHAHGIFRETGQGFGRCPPSAEQGANRTPHLRPGGQQDHPPPQGRDPFPRGVRRLCKGTPYQWQAPAHASQLEAVRGVSGQESFLPGTSLLHRIPLPHYLYRA